MMWCYILGAVTQVLDIAGPALQPKEFVNLALRRPSQRRISTQTWRFTEEGRLCCAHNNMCVQARDGFFGLKKGMTLLDERVTRKTKSNLM